MTEAGTFSGEDTGEFRLPAAAAAEVDAYDPDEIASRRVQQMQKLLSGQVTTPSTLMNVGGVIMTPAEYEQSIAQDGMGAYDGDGRRA